MASVSYDYVIVGGGSAGCVLANRLTEDPDVSVLLVEAGPPDTADFIHIPAAMAALFRSAVDWDHSTIWEANAANRRIYLPRGKTLGGSSSINAMIYIRGARSDWDGYAAEGCDPLGWDAMLPYFKKAEDNERGADEFHGAGGPLPVSDGRAHSRMGERFVEAAQAYGLALNPDFNGEAQDGVGAYQVTQKGGRRASAAVGYLHPVADRPNLTIETHLHVTKVVFTGTRAVGVEALRLSETLTFHADREVIVCGGTYNSPQLLTLSGIGRPDELALLQIATVAELPGVGLNLSDHPAIGATFQGPDPDSLKDALNEANLGLWATEGAGPLTSNIAETGGFHRTDPAMADPDIQFHFVPALFEHEGLLPPQEHGFTLSACVLKPKARGHVIVTSPDPTAKPLIQHDYLGHPDDLRSAIEGLRVVMGILGTEPLASQAIAPRMVPAGLDDASLEAHARGTLQTLYHPVGTCRMGSDPLAVVDTSFRVHGVEGLRVVDASILPSTPRGNTNAPVIAVAERAADIIRGRAPLEGAASGVAVAEVAA